MTLFNTQVFTRIYNLDYVYNFEIINKVTDNKLKLLKLT